MNLKEKAALWVLKLRELYKLPVSTVESIVGDIIGLMSLVITDISAALGKFHHIVKPKFKMYESLFSELESGYTQKSTLKKILELW